MFCSLALGSGLGCVSFTDSGFGVKVDFFGNFYFLPCSDLMCPTGMSGSFLGDLAMGIRMLFQ